MGSSLRFSMGIKMVYGMCSPILLKCAGIFQILTACIQIVGEKIIDCDSGRNANIAYGGHR